jgi:hypothetical protein
MPASINIQPQPFVPGNHQKLLIVLQYYNGDKEAAEDLATLIADLERIRNNQADILVFRRHDAAEFDSAVLTRLRDKFSTVHYERSRRQDASGYPFGPNQMWSDLVTMLGQKSGWYNNYYAFLPLESDCVPVRPGWISTLIEDFKIAKAKGYSAIGHVHRDPVEHMNGVAVYDTRIWSIVGGNILNGCNPQVAYDIAFRESLLPLAYDTPHIMMEYQRPTIRAEDLFRPWKKNYEPALFHGVKDDSARTAVRSKYVTFSDEKDASSRTVFTYEHQRPSNPQLALQYSLWSESWKSRGWNPVKLVLRDAASHARYKDVMATLNSMQFEGDKVRAVARVVRWLALDSVGGGLMVDPDTVPNNFNPTQLKAKTAILHPETDFGIFAAYLDKPALETFLTAVETYPADPTVQVRAPEYLFFRIAGLLKKPTLLAQFCGSKNWRDARIISFNQSEMERADVRGSTVQAIEQFLRGM